MLWNVSEISPITGVNTAPPTIAITSSEPPIFVFGPSPFKPIAKIVGNMSDMKKLVRNTHHNPNQPGNSTPSETSTCLLYTSDAADEEDSVDLGGRRIIK